MANPPSHTRRVQIAGETLQVRADAEETVIDQVAGFVDWHVRQSLKVVGESDRFKGAVLAGLNIAGELFETRQARDAAEKARERAEAQLRQLMDKLAGLSAKLDKE